TIHPLQWLQACWWRFLAAEIPTEADHIWLAVGQGDHGVSRSGLRATGGRAGALSGQEWRSAAGLGRTWGRPSCTRVSTTLPHRVSYQPAEGRPPGRQARAHVLVHRRADSPMADLP